MRTPGVRSWVKTQVSCSCAYHKGKYGGAGTAQLMRAEKGQENINVFARVTLQSQSTTETG